MCALFGALVGLQSPPSMASWLQLDTPEVHIVTDVSPGEARAIAADIGVYRFVLHELFQNWNLDPAVRPTLFLVNGTTWKKYVRQTANTAGFTELATGGHVIAADGHSWVEARPTVFHELTHHYLGENHRGHRLPVWYEEGLAGFLSTVTVWNSLTDSKVEVGRAPASAWVLRSRPLIPLQRIFTETRSTLDYSNADMIRLYYAESWLLVHYAFLGNREWASGMSRYLGAYASFKSPAEAVAAAFPEGPGAFAAALTAYLRAGKLPLLRISPVSDFKRPIVERQLSEQEGRQMLGRLLVRIAPQKPETLEFVAKTAGMADAGPAAAAMLGALYTALNRPDDARRWLGGSCTPEQGDPVALLFCGNAALDSALREPATAASDAPQTDPSISAALEARGFYERARAADGGDLDSLVGYGITMTLAPGDSAAVRADLEQALERTPNSAAIAEVLATIEFPIDARKSLAVLEGALLHAEDPETVARLLQQIRRVENSIATSSNH